jgi:hypothetical protein
MRAVNDQLTEYVLGRFARNPDYRYGQLLAESKRGLAVEWDDGLYRPFPFTLAALTEVYETVADMVDDARDAAYRAALTAQRERSAAAQAAYEAARDRHLAEGAALFVAGDPSYAAVRDAVGATWAVAERERAGTLTTREVAGILGKKPATIRSYAHRGLLTPIRVDGRTVVYARAEVEALAANPPRPGNHSGQPRTKRTQPTEDER